MELVKEPEHYSFLYGAWGFVKKALVFIVPSLIAYNTTLPADSQIAIALTAAIYLVQNYLKNKDK